MHTGSVRVAPGLPFGGGSRNPLKLSPIFTRKRDMLWLPVSAYLIEHPQGKMLVDCGWHREMSPRGEYDKQAQIRSLGSRALYVVNQGLLPAGAAVDEQLLARGIRPEELDYVLLTHLDCDHVNGLRLVSAARQKLVAPEELAGAAKGGRRNRIRYQDKWWQGCGLQAFAWNDTEGPVGRAFDLFGDGSIKLIAIPGHSEGLCAVKVKNRDGKFVLLFSDGGYADRSWQELILPGVATDKQALRRSLEWIREQSLSADCVASLANHDAAVQPHTIEL